jgi:hypothetical protein
MAEGRFREFFVFTFSPDADGRLSCGDYQMTDTGGGSTASEYGLILVLIALGIVSAVATVGTDSKASAYLPQWAMSEVPHYAAISSGFDRFNGGDGSMSMAELAFMLDDRCSGATDCSRSEARKDAVFGTYDLDSNGELSASEYDDWALHMSNPSGGGWAKLMDRP